MYVGSVAAVMATEMNREAAQSARELGERALRSGDHARAVKLLEKSARLHACAETNALLARARSAAAAAAGAGGAQSGGGGGGGGGDERPMATPSSGSGGRAYSDEDARVGV